MRGSGSNAGGVLVVVFACSWEVESIGLLLPLADFFGRVVAAGLLSVPGCFGGSGGGPNIDG